MFFLSARAQSYVHESPAEGVNILKNKVRLQRRSFTIEQIQKLLTVADAEWRREVRFTARKIGPHQKNPLAMPLKRFLDGTVPDEARSAFAHLEKQRAYERTGALSAPPRRRAVAVTCELTGVPRGVRRSVVRSAGSSLRYPLGLSARFPVTR